MALRYGPRAKLTASDYQKPDDPVRAIAERRQNAIGAKMARALKRLQRAVPSSAIAEKIKARDAAAAADLVNITSFAHDLRVVFEPIASAYRDAAKLGGQQVKARRNVQKGSATFSGESEQPDDFAVDLYSPEVLDELRAYQDALITSMTDDMRSKSFAIIMDGMAKNLPPEEIAEDLKYTCGLSVQLAKAVRSYRAALESGDMGALDRALRDGGSDAEIREAFQSGAALSKEKIDELTLAYANRAVEYRARMIAQTEATRAASMGLEAAYKQMIGSGLFPATAVRKHWRIALDERTCDACIAMAIVSNVAKGLAIGALFASVEDEASGPPLHPNCLPGDALVLAEGITAASKRWYDGDLIVIRTAGNNEIACTPNHPILTPGGWVAAHLLNEGDDVIGRRTGQTVMGSTDPNGDNVPARIEEVAESFGRSRQVIARKVKVTAPAFHGDGEGSDVAIVWSNGLLRNRSYSARGKKIPKFSLVARCAKDLAFDGLRSFALFFKRMLAPPSRRVCGSHLALAGVGAHAGPFQRLGLALIAQMNASFDQAATNGWARNIEMFGDSEFGHAASVCGNDGGVVGCDPAVKPRDAQWADEAKFSSVARDDILTDAVNAREVAEALFGQVIADKIVMIRREPFAGHVFNLETDSHIYLANGVVTHNCRCSLEVVTDLMMGTALAVDPLGNTIEAA
jgi:hypothetical protein